MKRLLLLLLGACMLFSCPGRAQQVPAALRPAGRLAPPDLVGPAGRAARPSQTTAVRPRQQVRYQWDAATAAWVQPQRDLLQYDTQGRLSEVVSTDSATAVPYQRVQYTYDARGNLTQELTQTGNGATWENAFRYAATYDEQDLLTEELRQTWATTAWRTDEGYRYQNAYAAGSTLRERTGQRLVQGTYVNDTRFQYTLTPEGRWSEAVAQRWDTDTWVNEERLTDLVWFNWDARLLASYRVQTAQSSNQWADFQRVVISYASSGTVTLVEAAQPGGGWQNYIRYTQPLDTQGNSLGIRQEDWQNSAWALTNELRLVLRYDAANRLIRRTEQLYAPISAQYVNQRRTNFGAFEEVVTAAAPAALAQQLQLYPNPARGAVQLQLSGLPLEQRLQTVEVVSLLGQPMHRTLVPVRQGQLAARLELPPLAPGVYLLRLPTPQGAVVRRFLSQ